MKKLYSLIATFACAAIMSAQATLPYNEGFTYPDGPLLGLGNWALVSSNADQIQVLGGIVKFDAGGEDLQQTITPTNSGTIYYAFDLNVTGNTAQTGTNGGYIAGFAQNNTTFGGTLWTKRNDDGTYKIGIEVRTATGTGTSWSTTDYTLNQINRVVVGYTFNTASTSDDVVNLWVNGALVTSDTHTGTDLTNIVSFFLRQDSASETPFIEIDNLTVTTTTEVLAVSDITSVKSNFIKNTLVNDAIEFTVKANVKIYNVNGQLVKSAAVNNGTSLNVSSLANGIYVVAGEVDGQAVSQKIIKK